LEKQKHKARSLGVPGKPKQKTKNKTLRRMFGFDSKDCFFVFPRCFCFFWFQKPKNKKNKKRVLLFFAYILSTNISKKNSLFFVFQHFRLGFLH